MSTLNRSPRPFGHATGAALAALIAALVAAALVLVAPAPSRAASLTRVDSFGANPGNLAMYLYQPHGLAPDAPLVVAMHGCGQTAQDYFANSGWAELADRHDFSLVLPQTSGANNTNECFNWFEPGDITRGQGETASINQMVAKAVSTYGVDPDRVFATGLSAGGAMTSVMLATYPDTFAGGSIVAGIAYRCATTLLEGLTCLSAPPNRTPGAWGDLVRDAYPGYDGPRPRVAIWHGTSDYIVSQANATESRDQFTDVLGTGQTPTATETLPAGTTRTVYGDRDVLVYSVSGMGHGLPVDPGTAAGQCGRAAEYFLDTICSAGLDAEFFGLTGTVPPDPDPDPDPTCATASNYAHTQAGRAYHRLGYTYAQGSGDPMGLWNTYQTTDLLESSPGYWEVGC